MPETTNPTDPRNTAVPSGIATTEFWVSALSILALTIGAILDSGLIPEGSPWLKILGIAGTVLIALGYTWNRSILKRDMVKSAASIAVAEAQAPVVPPAEGQTVNVQVGEAPGKPLVRSAVSRPGIGG